MSCKATTNKIRHSSSWRHVILALLVAGAVSYTTARAYASGLDCPQITGAGSALVTDLQVKLLMSGNRSDVANEISDLINSLQAGNPNISYSELTNTIITALCPVVADTKDLTASEKWHRMRLFESILQRQLTANMLPTGSLIIANIPLPPSVYHALRSQAAKVDQRPAQFMAAILSKAAGD